MSWSQVNCTLPTPVSYTDLGSLGWLELHTTLAKLHWKMDISLLSEGVDWHRDVEMQLLWKKPKIQVQATPRRLGRTL
jgi:hypothetical protein